MAPTRQEREAREARERLKAYTARQEVHRRQGNRRMRDNVIVVVGVVVVAALAALTQIAYFTAGPGKAAPSASPSATSTPAPSASAGRNVGAPDPSVAEDRTWTGSITLNAVNLRISLNGAKAPQAVAGFVTDAKDGYFVGKTCHRLAQNTDFGIIQCGSIDGKGGADPSYSYGPVENAPSDNVYPAGTIAIARAKDDGYSNGHQFFIAFVDTKIGSDAAGGYTVIGTVTSGLDELKSRIVAGGIAGGSSDGAPNVATTITGVTIK